MKRPVSIPNFLDILDKSFLKKVSDSEAKRKSYSYRHNPSSASIIIDGKTYGACLRQLYYKATKEPRTHDVEATGLYQMAFGDYIHEGLLKELAKCDKFTILPESSGKCVVDPLTFDISYRIDGLITSDTGVGGLELKTTQGRSLTDKSFGIKSNGPKIEHIIQIVTYFNTIKGLNWFALVYVARDTGYRLQYNFTRKEDSYFIDGKEIENISFNKIKGRWEKLEKHIETKTLPDRDYKVFLKKDGTVQDVKYIKGDYVRSDFHCINCPFQKTCWSGPYNIEDSLNFKHGV